MKMKCCEYGPQAPADEVILKKSRNLIEMKKTDHVNLCCISYLMAGIHKTSFAHSLSAQSLQ
jgi:hypothetical protein